MPRSLEVCVDANVVVRLIANPRDEAVQNQWELWDREGRRLVAPNLLRYEVTNALYRIGRDGRISVSGTQALLERALALPVHLYDDPALHIYAIEIAARHNRPATFDAHYLAFAERRGIDFWTADKKLANAVQRHLPWVHLVGA